MKYELARTFLLDWKYYSKLIVLAKCFTIVALDEQDRLKTKGHVCLDGVAKWMSAQIAVGRYVTWLQLRSSTLHSCASVSKVTYLASELT